MSKCTYYKTKTIYGFHILPNSIVYMKQIHYCR